MRLNHQRFVEEYARDWNATAAYKRAGYRARGHGAEVNASRLRRRPDVAAAVGVAVADCLAAVEARTGFRLARPLRMRGFGMLRMDTT